MNNIVKSPIDRLGYDFVDSKYLAKGRDEYFFRNQQNGTRAYRHLSAQDIETLVRNNNTSDNWNKLLVTEAFDADLVKQCHFYGLVRIGKLEPYFLEFHSLRLPVGLYNSTITSCDFGDNVVVHNVNSISHYIIGNEVMIANVNEMATTGTAKFGNGILKDGEEEKGRIWLEICNENGGRKVLPFEGMLPGDAFLWSKYRDDDALMKGFRRFTEKKFDHRRGVYGMVGDRCVIKNCKIIKDTTIGSDAYLKGANKIKNVTINSGPGMRSQIGEGCELVNGIVGYGCRIFYGVKAVRFFMASHSSLKYGARLINSYLGNNATVSCCEVLNSLIFPAHEQHHNNSFLCAAVVMGQSNMAAGATIGSNHNSRGADGELQAGRGFWPGLCVSLKHNSRFASFTLIAKGDYPFEINLPLPFSLLSYDASKNVLQVMPAYWFLYNMYALARNSWKHRDRDRRPWKIQEIEYDFLAPDSVEEIFTALHLMEQAAGAAYLQGHSRKRGTSDPEEWTRVGRELLQLRPEKARHLKIHLEGVENSHRPVLLQKADKAYGAYRRMIVYYGLRQIVDHWMAGDIQGFDHLKDLAAGSGRSSWVNCGGQLIQEKDLLQLREDVRSGVLDSWDALHERYRQLGAAYAGQKLLHAIASLLDLKALDAASLEKHHLAGWLNEFLEIQEWVSEQIYASRAKDYRNPFRKMVYENEREMKKVLGALSDNDFIVQTKQQTLARQEQVKKIMAGL